MKELAEQVKGLKGPYDPNTEPSSVYSEAIADAADLIANSPELAELKRDAERYRWLRDPSTPAAEGCMKLTSDGMSELLFGKELDAAIDAARGEPSPAAADAPIVVGGKVCKFHWHSGDGWSIWNGSEHLTSQGWRWAPTKDAPSFETLQAARDFARQCAEREQA